MCALRLARGTQGLHRLRLGIEPPGSLSAGHPLDSGTLSVHRGAICGLSLSPSLLGLSPLPSLHDGCTWRMPGRRGAVKEEKLFSL